MKNIEWVAVVDIYATKQERKCGRDNLEFLPWKGELSVGPARLRSEIGVGNYEFELYREGIGKVLEKDELRRMKNM